MMVRKIAVNVARLVIAMTFILSGFVKAVDPLGTQYKIVDYLKAMQLGTFVPDFLTLTASVLLSAVEFGLGICMLFAIRRRLVSLLALCMMIPMTALTLWLAVANPVTDCGCFGDAVTLTNREIQAARYDALCIEDQSMDCDQLFDALHLCCIGMVAI